MRRAGAAPGLALPVFALWLGGALLGLGHAALEPLVEHDQAWPHLSGGHADRQPDAHLDAAQTRRDHHCAACSPAAARQLAAPCAAAAALPTPAAETGAEAGRGAAAWAVRGPGSPRAPPALLG